MKSKFLAHSGLNSNFRHLYADIFWWGVLAGSALSFLAVYATRIGATSFQVGLLTAGPAVVNLILSLLAGRWLEQRSLIRAVSYSSIAHRAGYIPMIFLPWLLSASGQVISLELIVLVMSVPGTLLAISFNALFAQIVLSERRGQVVGWRNALASVSTIVSSLLCGRLLDWIAFPLNYQIVFFIGALGGALSCYHLSRLRFIGTSPPPAVRSLSDRAQPNKSLLRFDLLRGPFGSLMGVYLLFYTFQQLPVPLFPLAFVRVLHLSDGAISLGTALFHVSVLLGSMRLGWMSKRLGHRRLLILGALLYCSYPLLMGLAQNATPFWIASVIGGIAWGLTGAGLLNRLMERTPQDDLPAHMTLHNIVLNLGVLGGSMLGPVLAEGLGLRPALLLGAGLRLLSGILFILWG